MRRFWYAKYALTLLALTALTFHLMHSRTNLMEDREIFYPNEFADVQSPSYAFTKSSTYLRRKLSQGNSANSSAAPSWIVLQGNITVHRGLDIVPFNVPYLIRAENLCKDLVDSRSKLLIFIASSADHFAQRSAIRETWGLKLLQEAHNYRIVFLLGQHNLKESQNLITKESYRYGDLVQLNVTESFRNLGEKSVSGLHWSKDFCPEADFVMKTDDDILVHIPNLLASLAQAKNPNSLLMCHENRLRKILRKENLHESMPESYKKYVVSNVELPGIYYPPYCSGMAYAFSRSIRDRLLEASSMTPIFFIEDVYLTGFCRHKAGVVVAPHSGITLRPPINFHQASCSFRDGRITSHEVGADELRQLWAELNTQGFFCPQLVGYARQKKKS